MKKWISRTFLTAMLAASPALLNAALITQWNFNSNPPDLPANTGTGITVPSTGAGSLALVGGTTFSFASGEASGGSSDPLVGDDSAYNTTTYGSGTPVVFPPDETAGVRFNVSTLGFNAITLSFDQRHSNSSSRYTALYYTTDGTTFTKFPVSALNANPGVTPLLGTPASTPGLFGPAGTFDAQIATSPGDDWFNGISVDLSSIPGANNNTNFGFQVVTSMGGGTAYSSTNPANAYAGTGTLRYDMVTVNGSVIPEPSTFVFGGIGLIGLIGYGLRRRS